LRDWDQWSLRGQLGDRCAHLTDNEAGGGPHGLPRRPAEENPTCGKSAFKARWGVIAAQTLSPTGNVELAWV